MSGQSGGHRVCLAKLNEQLTCKLCNGYFIDATTIIECLHSFCRSCIVKYLENNKYCPICDVQVHKSRPLLNIRPDHTLQDIVYKLVPGCYQNEMKYRREFYAEHPEVCSETMSPEARGESIESHIYSPDESLSLSLEYFNPHIKDLNEMNIKEGSKKSLLRRYFRCPAAVTVFHLQKLIRAKYGLNDANKVDIMYKEESLYSYYTLMDVMYIYHWRRKVPLHLSYRIFESPSKRIKLSEMSYERSFIDVGIDCIDLKDEKSLKREWKEVQLKISETGVMSITDISSTMHKTDIGIESLQDEKAPKETITSIIEVNKTDSIIENCATSKSSTEIMQSAAFVIDAQATKKSIFPDSSNAFLATSDVKPLTEKSSTKNCISLITHNIENTRQTNCNVPVKLQQETQEIKDYQTADIADKIILQGQEVISASVTQFTNKSSTSMQNAKETDARVKKLINNNNNRTDFKAQVQKEYIKNANEMIVGNSGLKINALSAKLQFQPKIGQVNNTYLKKTSKEKRVILQHNIKKTAVKSSMGGMKFADMKTQINYGDVTDKVSILCSTITPQKPIIPTVTSSSASMIDSSSGLDTQEAVYVTDNQSKSINVQQVLNLLEQKTNSSMQILTESIPKTNHINMMSQRLKCAQNNTKISENVPTVPNVSTPMISQTTPTFPYTFHEVATKSVVLKPALKNSDGDCCQKSSLNTSVCTTANTQTSCMSQFDVQAPSMSVYPISTSLKNNYNNANQATTNVSIAVPTMTITPTETSKPISSGTCSVPPCPDAIPISVLKQSSTRKQEVTAKGTNLNEICAKIGSNTIGSKINDICAKIGENSKEKNKIETRSKLDVPDLLKINAKKALFSNPDTAIKHIPNIPSVPVYTSSGNVTTTIAENKSGIKSALPVSTASLSMSSHATSKGSSFKKQNQPVGYKTLRDPPKSWNPTLSKNNYVAVKNQTKEMHNQTHISASEGTSKQIPSKPAKIFKMRNMPRYLGNPASGVKPMYGVTNDTTKEKEQLTNDTKSSTLNMMKIDPKTLSPIVSTINSPIISPSPYPPSARSYQNTPFSRDICRNTGSSISPRNSPVNMLSTNPFIPSPKPNTNPRIIYSHFPPPFPDASRFPNPLIRSPIGISPPSAFHSSLPPSINKLYQRSTYMLQTTNYSSISSQLPAVQRIPPSTHSSSPKSPKASSPNSISSASFNLGKVESQSPITSTVDSVALLLSKSVPTPVPMSVPEFMPVAVPVSVPVSTPLQRELNAFNISKTGSLGPSSNTIDANTEIQTCKQNSSTSSAAILTVEIAVENTSVSSSTNGRKQYKDIKAQKVQETMRHKEENLMTKFMEVMADNIAYSTNKQEKTQATKINGDITTEQFANKKLEEEDQDETSTETVQQGNQVERYAFNEQNNVQKSNIQVNINDMLADSHKNEDFGKDDDQIQGTKPEVQRNKVET